MVTKTKTTSKQASKTKTKTTSKTKKQKTTELKTTKTTKTAKAKPKVKTFKQSQVITGKAVKPTAKPKIKKHRATKLIGSDAKNIGFIYRGYTVTRGADYGDYTITSRDCIEGFQRARGFYWLTNTNKVRRAKTMKQAKQQIDSYIQFKHDIKDFKFITY